jgi:23S rRNA (cytidine1920-2'-O)/16S rRNA (cytidine1409-2'-O)-methyltransferase
MRVRLDLLMAQRALVGSRSEADNWIKLGKVFVNGRPAVKAGLFVDSSAVVELRTAERYVSRAGLKLASVADTFGLEFAGKRVLDVGSSTGGFTDYALQHGAHKVYAIDVGTQQLHPSLRRNSKIELHEKTDIRDFRLKNNRPDITVIDVSFISLRDILPHIAHELSMAQTQIVAMVKPQFEAGRPDVNKGIIKNNAIRRRILSEFEAWAKELFVIQNKADSAVKGAGGNEERFYALKLKH